MTLPNLKHRLAAIFETIHYNTCDNSLENLKLKS
jgi:hypothetical protein